VPACLPAILTDTPDATLQTSTSGPVLSIQLQDNPADVSKTVATWKPKLKSWFSFALLYFICSLLDCKQNKH